MVKLYFLSILTYLTLGTIVPNYVRDLPSLNPSLIIVLVEILGLDPRT